MKKVEVLLEGLTCANCAAKIEKKLSERVDIKNVSLDFNTSVVHFSVNEALSDRLKESIEKDILAIEDVVVHFESQKEEDQNKLQQKTNWSLKIGIGVASLVLSLTYLNPISTIVVFVGYLYIGSPVLTKAIKRLLSKQWFDENFLMSIATLGAIFINEWPEAIGVMLFYTVGEYFQDRAVEKSRKHISSLLDIQVNEAVVIDQGKLRYLDPSQVQIKDKILVAVGAKIPCDGVIIEGQSSLDTSSLTGESLPVDVSIGTQVMAGSINLQQSLIIEVNTLYEHSALSKLTQYLKESSKRKAKLESTMTRFAAYYTPIVVGLAVALLFSLMLFGMPFATALHRSLVFLVISCPCALVISVPLSYFASMGYASQKGILFKGGEALESANKIDALIFDKTGTLTHGKMSVVHQISLISDSSHALKLIKALESHSTHPIASALVQHCIDVTAYPMRNIQELSGVGMKGEYQNSIIRVSKVSKDELSSINHADLNFLEHLTWVGVYENDQLIYIVGITDQIKESSYPMIKKLKELGIKSTMISGDHEGVVNHVQTQLEIDQTYASCLPHQKVELMQEMMKDHHIGFVGDGINDSAALTLSHCGIAMGLKGSDLAIEASDVVILNDDMNQLIEILSIAKRNHISIIQNLFMVFLVKGVVLVLGSLGLVGMWEAVFADVGVALLAILNAMRILYQKK